MSMGSCGFLEMKARGLFIRFDCYFGGKPVSTCGDGPECVKCTVVCVVKGSSKPLRFGGISLVM